MRHYGVLLVMVAAVFWGISGALANVLMNRGWSPLVIAFYRGAVGFIFFLIWTTIHFKPKRSQNYRFYLWAILAGIGVAGNFTFYFYSIEAASISIAVTLMYSAPVFVLLTSLIAGIERPSLYKWGSVAMVLLGIMLLTESYAIGSIPISFSGTLFGLGSGLSYALFIFGFKNASTMASTKWILSVSFLVFSVILLMLMDTSQAKNALFSRDLIWFIMLGILGAGLSFILYVVGLRTTSPSTASIVAMVEPVTASIIGLLFLNNALSFPQGIGMVMILITIGLLNSKSSTQTMHTVKGRRS